MAPKKGGSTKSMGASLFREKPKVKRPGVHAKTKASKLKGSKNYLKKYRSQGRK